MVNAELDGLPAFVFQADSHLSTFFRGRKQDSAGIGGDPVSRTSPQFIQGLAADLANYVPKRNIHARRPFIRRAVNVVTKSSCVLLNIERVLTNEQRSYYGEMLRVHGGTYSHDTLISVDLNNGGPTAPKRQAAAYVPGRFKRSNVFHKP